MNFQWSGGVHSWRCYTAEIVTVTTREWGGNTKPYKTQYMGYILRRDGRLMACVYGNINPDATGQYFDNIDDAKRYVEEQATVGLALNKLTR